MYIANYFILRFKTSMKVSFNNNSISFKSYNAKTVTPCVGNPLLVNSLEHYTCFFRNYDTLKFTSDYVKKTFCNGANIAEFGCSQGQKSYSLLMLLDDVNQNKKFKIVGYDFAKPISDNKKQHFKVNMFNRNERIIFNDEKLKSVFDKYFKKIESKEVLSDHLVMPNLDKTVGVIDFKEGNILNIDKILPNDKNSIIVFQNALHHILQDSKNSIHDNFEIVYNLFQKIHNKLPKDGLFVLGTLFDEHQYSKHLEGESRLIYQNNERIRVFDSSRIHGFLKTIGFEPIFYESVDPVFKENIFLPTVWKKINRL